MDSVAEIKSRLNIEDIVSEYVQLKRAGRNFKGLSPFTNEKSPSFIVSPDKQIWHDFSSGKGGDIISFIETVEGLDFKGALELLARKAGVELKDYNSSSPNNNQKERLFKVVEATVRYYQVQLTKNDTALKYVREKRGYTKQTLIDFRFGYSPSGSDNLVGFLQSKGFDTQEMLKAGVAIKRDNRVIDMFRDRIMIPLCDTAGRPVGFTARQITDNKNSPKYINTPATILYDKSRQLFGFSQAKEHIRKTGYVVVVEGNLDVVASYQAGVKQVVASAGTAITTSHLKSLQRFTGDIRLAFDDDRAGQDAAERAIPLAQDLGLELSFIEIPSGKDPDELIKQDVELWQKTIDNPKYMVDWLIDRIASTVDLTTAPGKRQFTSRIFEIVNHIKDSVEKEHYLRIISDKTKTSLESINSKFNTTNEEKKVYLKRPKNQPEQESKFIAEQRVKEQHFLAIVSVMGEYKNILNALPKVLFSPEAQAFLESTNNMQEVKKDEVYGRMLALLFEENYQHTEPDEIDYQVKQLANRLIEFYTHQEKLKIQEKLDSAREDQELELLKKVTELDKLKREILSAISN